MSLTDQQQKLRAILARLEAQTTSQPATPAQLDRFVQRAVANPLRAEAILGFHSCDELILFEWWDQQELWLSQRDFYALRGSRGQFCLGEASTRSFSPADQADWRPHWRTTTSPGAGHNEPLSRKQSLRRAG